MSTPTVSVVMPARNAAETLTLSIRSLRDQTLDDIEIVLVDHGSSDGTHGIMLREAAIDSRIRVLQCRGSFVEAANLAWRSAAGELVARMDSDDFAHPERLLRQREYLESRPHLAGCGTRVRILKRTEEGRFVPPDDGYRRYENWVNSVVTEQEIAAGRFIDSPLPNPTAMIRRTVLEELGGYHDPPWAEDYDLWLRMLGSGYRLGKIPEVLLDWHDSGTRATRRLERYALARFQEAKARYLSRVPAVRDLGVVVCGAGPTGKEMAGLLAREGVRLHAFVEVNVRQIGNRIHGLPVLDNGVIPDFAGKAIALSAVGRESGRGQVRDVLVASGFVEGESFFCVA